MADEPLVIKVYAEALLAVVQKAEIPLQEALSDAEVLGYMLETRRDFMAFLEGPHISTEEKHGLTQKAFEGRIPDHLYNLIRICIDKDRCFCLIDMLAEFVTVIETALGIHSVRVLTAVEIDEELRREVKNALEVRTGLKFRPRFGVDEKLIGGIVLQYEDWMIDMSLRGQLQGLRETLGQAVAPITA